MALRQIESADWGPSLGPKGWVALGFNLAPAQSSAARTGPAGVLVGGNNTYSGMQFLPQDGTLNWFVGCAVRLHTGQTTGKLAIRASTASGGGGVATVALRADGMVELINGEWNVAPTTTIANPVPVGQWGYVEVGFVINAGAGSIVVKINGTQIAQLVGLSNGSTCGGVDIILVDWNGGKWLSADVDDIYIADNLTAQNNTFLGDTHVQVLWPVSGNNGWNPSNILNPNAGLVNEQGGQDGDGSYVYTKTPGQLELYGLGGLFATAATIAGAIWNFWVRKDDAGLRVVAPVARSAGIDSVGPELYLADSASYTLYSQAYPQDPNTAAPWAQAALAAASFGVSAVQ